MNSTSASSVAIDGDDAKRLPLVKQRSTLRESHRLSQLDAVRGIASLVVVFEHFADLFYRRMGLSLADPVSVLKASPLGVLIQGPAAVVTFFVLSGFVLSLPLEKAAMVMSWPSFVAKRILRLQLPFVAGLALAAIADSLFSTHGIPALNSWFNSSWTHPVDVRDVMSHAMLVNHFEFNEYNKAYWTLAYEMQISLVFPVLFWLGAPLKLRTLIGVSVLMMLIGTVQMGAISNQAAYLISVAGLFLLGSGLARNREPLKLIYSAQPPSRRWILAAFALLIFAYAGLFKRAIHMFDFGPALMGVAAGFVVIAAIADRRWMGFLKAPLCQFLGRISYSLYLVHLTVLYSLVYLTYGKWAAPSGVYWCFFFIAYISLALIFGALFYFLVERPCTALSQKVRIQSGKVK